MHQTQLLKSDSIDQDLEFQSKYKSNLSAYEANLNRSFHEVVLALLVLYKSNCILPSQITPISSQITKNH
jgi:hypothetical protein